MQLQLYCIIIWLYLYYFLKVGKVFLAILERSKAGHALQLVFIQNKQSCFTGVMHSSVAHLILLTTILPGALLSSCFEEVIGQLTSAVGCSRGEGAPLLFEQSENIGRVCAPSWDTSPSCISQSLGITLRRRVFELNSMLLSWAMIRVKMALTDQRGLRTQPLCP